MNGFDYLVADLKRGLADGADVALEISAPAQPEGVWYATLNAADGYSAEATWSRHRGFSVDAGYDFEAFAAPDESYATWQDTANRMMALWSTRGSTSRELPVPIAELRKLRGQLQKDIAAQLCITKGGLSQIEASIDEGKVQVDTLSKLLAAMGGKLILSASFPDGTERKLAVGR